jgi:dTDP-4-amino-4,6-dideoxygalactose transaminase
VAEFEKAAGEYLGSNYVVGVSSGTDAILIAMMALMEITGKKHPTVLTTPYTFIASVDAPLRVGAKVEFCDIDTSFNINVDLVKKRIRETDDIDIFLPVHLFGNAIDLDDELMFLCAEKGITVIEDCAQSFGSRYPFTKQFTGTKGHIGCFSFFPSKNLGCAGDGGLVITNNGDLYGLMKSIRSHGGLNKYDYGMMGGNFRLDTIQAALLLAKLPFLEQWKFSRIMQSHRYGGGLEELAKKYAITLPYSPQHTYNQYVILVSPQDRDPLVRHLSSKGIPTMNYYPASILDTPFARKYGLSGMGFAAACAAKQNIALPIAYPTEEESSYVVGSIKEYFEKCRIGQ